MWYKYPWDHILEIWDGLRKDFVKDLSDHVEKLQPWSTFTCKTNIKWLSKPKQEDHVTYDVICRKRGKVGGKLFFNASLIMLNNYNYHYLVVKTMCKYLKWWFNGKIREEQPNNVIVMPFFKYRASYQR